MPIVVMPDGQKVEFPYDMSKEEIKAVILQKYPSLQQQVSQEPQEQESSLLSDIGESLGERGQQYQEIMAAKRTQGQSLPETGLQLLGTGVGAAGDVLGSVLGKGVSSAYQSLPESAQETIEDLGEDIIESSVGKMGMKAIQEGGQAWADFEANYPRAARNIGAIFNIGAAIPVTKAGKVGAEFVGESAEALAKAPMVKEGAEQIAKRLNQLSDAVKVDPIKTASEIRFLAGNTYKMADEVGGVLKPKFSTEFVSEINKLRPQTEIGKLVGGDSPFSKVLEKLSVVKNKPISLQAAQEVDELLGDAIDGFTEMGKLTKEGKKLLDVQNTFRNMISEAPLEMVEGGKEGFNALKKARKLWSQSRKMEDIERIIQRASMTDNPATAIKTGFRNLYNSPGRMKGFTAAEKKLIGNAAQSGVVTDLFRTIGSRLVPIMTGTTGAGLGATAAATAASTAARGAASRMQVRQAQKVLKEISKGVE